MLICLCILHTKVNAQYTNNYNNITYNSARPYNLNLIYFVPNNVPLDPTYTTRISELMLWGQDFYKQNMMANGYGTKTFGLFTEATNASKVKIILIHGALPASSYPYNDSSKIQQEVDTYFNNNPSQKTSARTLVITACANSNVDAPFYGLDKIAFAIDFAGFKLEYLNTPGAVGDKFRTYFGGMLHELGHGLGLPHSHQTKTENNDPNKGMNLMFAGNSTIGTSTHTFMNRAGCALLNSNQLFADNMGGTYRNGHNASIKNIKTSFANGNLIISGTFESNRPVVDVNIYQDPYATPSAGYYKVAWSVKPIGNTFSATMPVNDLETIIGPYNLQVELVLNNEEREFQYFPFNYNNGVPDIENNTFVGGSLTLNSSTSGVSYQWQYQTSAGTWNNYTEGTVPGYGNFAGTKTNTLFISNISGNYINSPLVSRVAVTLPNNTVVYTTPQTSHVYGGITVQPADSSTACVGGTLQLSTQASGASFQWQYQGSDNSWYDFTEGNVPGYATFSGTKTPVMTISNISGIYASQLEKARLVVSSGKLSEFRVSNTANWKAENISFTQQPPSSMTVCVNQTLVISAGASGASKYQWQYQDSHGNWNNYAEGTVSGYGTFSGTKTSTLSISNVGGSYVNYNEKTRLLAIGAGGCTVTSNIVSWKAENVFITQQPPTSLTGCVGGSLSITVGAYGATKYQWQYQDSNGNWNNYNEGTVSGYGTFTGTQSAIMTISNLGSIYATYTEKARVLITGAGGCPTASSTVNWTAQNCSSKMMKASPTMEPKKGGEKLTDGINSTKQSVYPNPVQDELTVNLGSSGKNYQVQVLSIDGKVIYQTTTSDNFLKIPFSDKPSTNYLVVVKNITDNSVQSFKVIKK